MRKEGFKRLPKLILYIKNCLEPNFKPIFLNTKNKYINSFFILFPYVEDDHFLFLGNYFLLVKYETNFSLYFTQSTTLTKNHVYLLNKKLFLYGTKGVYICL